MKALLFDLGGVLIDIDFQIAFGRFEKISSLDHDQIKNRFQMDEMYKQHEIGQLDWTKYASHLRSTFELDANDDEIAQCWNSIFKGEISQTTKAIEQFDTNTDCYMFSNTNTTHYNFWNYKYPQVVSLFKQVFISSELGLRKPDVPAFEAISQSTGYALEDLVFFDDTEENIDGARKAGLDAVLVNSPVDVITKLKQLKLI